MGIRETMNKNPALAYGIAGAFVVVALGIVVYHFKPPKAVNMDKAYFTEDDGATTFVDSNDNIPPFDHNGKTAVKLIMYSYHNGKMRYIGYLQRWTDDVAAKMKDPAKAKDVTTGDIKGGSEVKLPNSPAPWVNANSSDARLIFGKKSPDGTPKDSVIPGYNN